MKMAFNWMHLKLHEHKKTSLTLPDHIEKSVADDDAFFEVIGIGPECEHVKVGQIVAVNPIHGVIRMRLPKAEGATFALRESELIGTL
jgi:hypothetical protein